MKDVEQWLERLAWQGCVWLLRAPILLTMYLVRLWAARSLLGNSIICRTCGEEISCIGFYECHCGFKFYGWYWGACPRCQDTPAFLDCGRCGASTLNPLIF